MNNKESKARSGLWVEVKIPQEIENLARQAVDSAFLVHRELGPGLLESAYRDCFCHELSLRGIHFRKEILVPLCYRGMKVDSGFRADVLLEDKLVVELKAVESVLPIHKAQLITYLKVLGIPLGLLINFNEVLIKNGIHRTLNLRKS